MIPIEARWAAWRWSVHPSTRAGATGSLAVRYDPQSGEDPQLDASDRRVVTLSACALVAAVCILLAAAAAYPADARQPVVHTIPPPAIVKETARPPDNDAPRTVTLPLIGIGAAAALRGAGHLGARIPQRTSGASLTAAAPATSLTPASRGQAARTGR